MKEDKHERLLTRGAMRKEIGRRELLVGAVGEAALALRSWSVSAQGSKTRLILLGTGGGPPVSGLPSAFLRCLKARTSASVRGPSTSAIERFSSSENGAAASSQPAGVTSNRLASSAMKIFDF